jgi:hypothetical protein
MAFVPSKMASGSAASRRKIQAMPKNSVPAEPAILCRPNPYLTSLAYQSGISDFDLQRFGKVLRVQDETPNTGWVIIERPFRVPVAHRIPGWATVKSTDPLKPGDTIPLRPDLELH